MKTISSVKNAVQKASNFIKDSAKYAVMIGATALAGYGLGGETAKGSQLSNYLNANDSGIQNSSAELTHHTQPSYFNINFIIGHTPAVDIFYDINSVKKKGIGKPADSNETQIASIGGRNLVSSKSCELSANIGSTPIFTENNMTNKKVIGRLYDTNDTPNINDDILLGTYDFWNMTESGQKINLTVRNGTSHLLKTSFYNTNIADFNNDGKVDLRDFAQLANDYKKPIGNYLTDISGPLGIPDGYVDMYDLEAFCDNWLQ
jgi:hypothetical protein